jgi:hypothetical protein
MVERLMESMHFRCPKCGQAGMLAKLQGQTGFRITDEAFRWEERDGDQEIVCANCDALAFPKPAIVN